MLIAYLQHEYQQVKNGSFNQYGNKQATFLWRGCCRGNLYNFTPEEPPFTVVASGCVNANREKFLESKLSWHSSWSRWTLFAPNWKWINSTTLFPISKIACELCNIKKLFQIRVNSYWTAFCCKPRITTCINLFPLRCFASPPRTARRSNATQTI